MSEEFEPKVTIAVIGTVCPEPRLPPLPDHLFAREGDRIVCDTPDEHHIATFAITVRIGDWPQTATHFTDWQIPEPVIGTPADQLKCHCGARWHFDGHYRFKGGWR